jgi:hypothetical protein
LGGSRHQRYRLLARPTNLPGQTRHRFRTNAERNFIIAELKQCGAIGAASIYQPRQRLPATPVKHNVTDDEIAAARLSVETE